MRVIVYFSYLLLHRNHPKHRSLQQWQSFICSQFCHLVRIQWGQFVSPPYGVSWGSSTGAGWPTSKMAHSQGWQVSAGCELGSQRRLLARAAVDHYLGLSTWLLGVFHSMAGGLQGKYSKKQAPRSKHFSAFHLYHTCQCLTGQSSMTKFRVNVRGKYTRV